MLLPGLDDMPLTVGVGEILKYPGASLICSSKITSIRADDTIMTLCSEGAIPSLAVIDVVSSSLPARSAMADLSNVMRGVASDESGGVGYSVISSTLYGIEDPVFYVCRRWQRCDVYQQRCIRVSCDGFVTM